jgi:hypothetical protein
MIKKLSCFGKSLFIRWLSDFCQTGLLCNPGDGHLYTCRLENLRSHPLVGLWPRGACCRMIVNVIRYHTCCYAPHVLWWPVFLCLQLWMVGGPPGRSGQHAVRTASTIAVETAPVRLQATVGSTVWGEIWPLLTAREGCALVSCCEALLVRTNSFALLL